jgi:hypothetical protein
MLESSQRVVDWETKMPARIAYFCVAFAMMAWAAGSPPRASAATPDTLWALTAPGQPTIPQVKHDPPAPATRPATPPETPNAPLPPAVWPGLILLAVLGGAKLAVEASRKMARR